MVGTDNVNLLKEVGTVQSDGVILYVGQRIPIRNSLSIQTSVISTWPSVIRFLRHHVEWSCPVIGGRPNNASFQHVLELSTCNFELVQSKSKWPEKCRRPGSDDVVSYVVADRFFSSWAAR